MSVQFSGLGSGLPIDEWITKLVNVKKAATITPLENSKTTLTNQNSALGVIKSSFTTLQNSLKALIPDVLEGDIWSKTSVKSSDSNYVTATGTSSAFAATTSVQVLQLATGTVAKSAGDIVSNTDVSATSTALASDESPFTKKITEGDIEINGQTFTIGEKTTLNDLLKQINSNKDAGVTAAYNTLTNKLTLTSTETGEKSISLSSGDTGFFEAMGLLDDSGDIIDGTQTLGKNAEAMIDGTKIVSASNTLTSAQTGIQGLTITLVKEPDDTSKEFKLTTSADTLSAKKAMQEFVDAYNTVVSQMDEAVKQNGYLKMDSGLMRIQQELRTIATSLTENDGKYSMLSQIGVSTSLSGASMDTETITLKIDADKLNKAFDENIDSVKKLFINDGKGLAEQLLDKVSGALKTETGFFDIRGNTLTKQIADRDSKLTKANENLTFYKELLTKQFSAMDKVISNLNSQYAAFTNFTSSSAQG